MPLLLLLLAAPLDHHGDDLPAGATARLGTVRLRSPNGFTGVTFSPDGKHLLTGDGTGVTTWDVASGKRLGRREVGATVLAVRFSRDGKVLAAVTAEGVLVLDPKTGGVLRRLGEPRQAEDEIEDFTLSPDGLYAVIGDPYGQSFRVVRTDTGAVLGRVDNLEGGRRTHASFTPDGTHFVTPGKDGRLVLYATATGKPVRDLEPAGGGARARAGQPSAGVVSDDGKEVICASGRDPGLVIRELATGRVVRRVPTSDRSSYYEARALTLLPGGRFLASAETGSTVRIWGLASGRLMREFPMPSGEAGVAFAPDGSRVAIAAGHVIEVWDVHADRRLHAGPTERPSHLIWTRDGKRLVSLGPGAWWVWDVRTGVALSTHTGMPATLGGAWRAADEALGFTSTDRAVWRWAVGAPAAEPVTRPVRADGGFGVLGQSRDGRWVVSRSRREGPTRLTDLAGDSGEYVLDIEGRVRPGAAAFSPDSRLLAVGTPESGVKLFETLNGREKRRLPEPPAGPGHQHVPNRLTFSPDGRVLARLDVDLQLIEVWTGDVRLTLSRERIAHTIGPTWSDDGRLIGLGLTDGQFVVLDAWTGAEVLRRSTSQGAITALAFSPDGRRVATAGQDTTVLVWDVPGVTPLKPAGGGSAWDDLRSSNAATGWTGMRALIAAGDAAAVATRLKPATPLAPGEMAKLVAGLGDRAYAVREASRLALEAVGEPARRALELARRGDSLDARRTAERLLARLDGDGIPPARLRRLRAVEVLERIGGRTAQATLRGLAADADALVREAARASLGRMAEAARPVQ